WDSATNTATFNITGILPDGDYRATLNPSGITNTSGIPLSSGRALDFFFLEGDANGDRSVDTIDFNILVSNFGQTGKTFSLGNFDYDASGNVDTIDFNLLASNFSKYLAPASTPLTGRRDAAPNAATRPPPTSLDPSTSANLADDLFGQSRIDELI